MREEMHDLHVMRTKALNAEDDKPREAVPLGGDGNWRASISSDPCCCCGCRGDSGASDGSSDTGGIAGSSGWTCAAGWLQTNTWLSPLRPRASSAASC